MKIDSCLHHQLSDQPRNGVGEAGTVRELLSGLCFISVSDDDAMFAFWIHLSLCFMTVQMDQ